MKYIMSMMLGAALTIAPLQAEPKSTEPSKTTTIPYSEFFAEEKPLDESFFMSKPVSLSTTSLASTTNTTSLEGMLPTTGNQCDDKMAAGLYGSVSQHAPTTGTTGNEDLQEKLYGIQPVKKNDYLSLFERIKQKLNKK